MVVKYDYFFKDKPIRILQNLDNKSVGPHVNKLGKHEYAAYVCFHKPCPDLWFGRLLAFPIYKFDWLDDFVRCIPMELFMFDKKKGLCSFYVDDMCIFSPYAP